MKIPFVLVAMSVLILGPHAWADDVYYKVPFSKLELQGEPLPRPDDTKVGRWDMYRWLEPRVVVDRPAEAYVVNVSTRISRFSDGASDAADELVVRVPTGTKVAGTLIIPKPDFSGAVARKFTLPESSASVDARSDFLLAKERHYSNLQMSGHPGTAWFRRQSSEAQRQRGTANVQDPAREGFERPTELEDTYSLFVGGQAVSENLQLNRDISQAGIRPAANAAAENLVPIGSIEGITVQAMDWSAAIGDAKPTLDSLAGAIPADQHAAFFSSFDALLTMLEETSEKGLPVFRAASERSSDGKVVEKYQRQLGLRPTALTRMLGSKVVKSVAITGSDPYFPTGTDVAVIFQAVDAKTLSELLLSQVRAASVAAGGVEKTGEAAQIHYVGFASSDRMVSSYIAVVGENVVVSNSVAQLSRLAAMTDPDALSIASLPEYKYFRARYPVGGEGETGFVFLSDAAIRRWCGPEWRIGASRRLRAGAIMADVTAAHMDDLVRGLKDTVSATSDTPMRTIGELSLTPTGVRSSVYGSAAFLTPIVELGIKQVAPDEAESYKRWRDSYQRNWRWGFDPIAISFTITPKRIAADMTVMPLIVASEYRSFVEFGRGAVIGPGSGDPHDDVAHAVFAVNVDSSGIKQANSMARGMAFGGDVDPFGWLGKSVAVYADADPLWSEVAKASASDTYLEKNIHRLPIGLYAEVGSALKLTAFLASLRTLADQMGTGMIGWETRKHNDQEYVRAGLTEKAKADGAGDDFDKLSIYYAATPKALLVALNEDVLKRAIDRQQNRVQAKGEVAAQVRPWLGSSMCLQVSREGLRLLNQGLAGSRHSLQHAAWSNIPILNEWKRRYPDQDPVRVHEERWGVRLLDPAGGTYVWDSEFQTMGSSVYGHPGQPKDGPEGVGPLNSIESVNAGITFENKGLRAKASVERSEAKPATR